jgi:DNA-binding SARP family transcriptional activator
MHAEFGLLGPLQVLIDGRELELRRPKLRSLVALLLLRAGEVVSTDRLVEDLWAGRPPKTAVGSLQNLVSELRKSLGPEVVKTRPPGYVLDVDPEHVDLHRFERLVAQAAETERAEQQAALLREALALWRGPPLADLATEAFAHLEVGRLEERQTAAKEDLVDAELELGRHARLVGELEALVAQHPLRERLRGQLMLALYRSGRQAEALDAYRAARETLVEELGIEPSPELQRLEQAILRHDEELDLVARAAPPAPAQPERRKTVTVLFTDVVDSTTLGASLDPEVTRGLMRRYFDAVRTIVERHGGTVEKFIGDAVMAVFGIPHVHEDDALRAVRSANELRQVIATLNTDLELEHGVALQIRTGIDTGEVLAGDSASGESFATGNAVNIAMRLQQAALPAEILIGPTTHKLVREAAATEPVEAVELGGALGKLAPHRLVFVTETGASGRPRRASFVGRVEELNRLRAAFDRTRAERRSRVVTVFGDAGIGKSRLVEEFASPLGDDVRVVVGRCLSYGEGATYSPIAEIVRRALPQRPQAAIAALLGDSDDAELIARHLAHLTGDAAGGASTGEIFWAIRRLFEVLASDRPLVVVLEDIHWAEPTLLDLFEYLGAWISQAPVLFLCLARPTLLDERPGWGARASAETVSLDPLSAEDAARLVEELAGVAELSDAVRKRIVGVSEGNALFIEQLHAYVTEDLGPQALEDVPPSIEALLASRVDTLDAAERALVERAAVIGRDFGRSAVLHLSPPEELSAVDSRLMQLERRGLVHAVRGRPGEEESLRFDHVLIRDVAYAGITKEERANLHERHAAWLEQRNESDAGVGYHAEQAHRFRAELRPSDPELPRLASWAAERLSAAGLQAWKRADTPATINLLERAAQLLARDHPNRCELLNELGTAYRAGGEFEQAQRNFEEAISAGSRDRRTVLRAEIELAHVRLFGEPEHSTAELLDRAERAIPVFEEVGDDRALGRTWRHVGNVESLRGQISAWQVAAERALVHYRRSGWSVSGCLAEIAAALFYGPTPVPEAIARCDELLREAPDRMGKANVLAFLGGLQGLAGSFDDGRRLTHEADKIYEEIGETYSIANNSGRVRARIELLSGDPAAAERILRDCCSTFERVSDQQGLSTLAAELADALYVQGRYDEAAGWIELARERARADDVSAQFAWRRVQAKLLARSRGSEEARAVAAEAEAIVAETDDVDAQGVVLLDAAEVSRLTEHPEEVAALVERGRARFEAKGNLPAAGAAEALLRELALA